VTEGTLESSANPEEDSSLNLRLTPLHVCCFTPVTHEERRPVEPLPDLPTLSDDDLRAMIRELETEEDEVSFRRRILHGRIDILRAELVARLREQVSAGEAKLADVERLSEILTAKAAPTDDE
jgi:anti-sigma-K factor RsiG